ncbi:MAG: peptide-methionine (S)-S-oxide reductase MsrA [Patescibacteria group bacterium]
MTKKIILAGGCYWCVEAIFRRITGVTRVVSGYAGGPNDTAPSYESVSTGKTGHAEAVLIEFDENLTNLETILGVFWEAHDPTTLDRQGPDIGTQYRSGIYYFNDNDLAKIRQSKILAQKLYPNPIVTEIKKLEDESHFFKADNYHQNYYDRNKDSIYCVAIVKPKIAKIEKRFGIRKSRLLAE